MKVAQSENVEMIPQDAKIGLVLFVCGDVDGLLGLDDVFSILDYLFCGDFDFLELHGGKMCWACCSGT